MIFEFCVIREKYAQLFGKIVKHFFLFQLQICARLNFLHMLEKKNQHIATDEIQKQI
jgi:hypothetical protein